MSLTEKIIQKRLSSVNTSQDSVLTTSMWIMHYKDSIDKVAKCWMEIYKNTDDQHRLALIYVMNDVVQKMNKKERGDLVKMAFHPHVVNACGLGSASLKKPISRVIDVFSERRIFPSHIIEEMKAALGVLKPATKEQADIDENFSDIDHSVVIREIELYYQNAELTEKARNILERSNFNFKDKMQDRMKDKSEGTKILAELDESKNKLIQFVNSVERHQNKCHRLVELLKTAKSSLNLQLRDVTIVDDAYEKFGSGILETKKRLEALMKSDDLTKNNEIKTLSNFFKDCSNEGSSDDMDMDEEDCLSNNTSLIPPSDYIAPISAVSATSTLDPRLQRLLDKNKPKLNQKEQRAIELVVSKNSDFSYQNDPRQRSKAFVTKNNIQTSKPEFISINSMSETTCSQPISISQIQPVVIDTSKPPPLSITTSSNDNSFSSTGLTTSENSALLSTSIVFNSPSFPYVTSASHMPLLPSPHLISPASTTPLNFSLPPPFISNSSIPISNTNSTFTPLPRSNTNISTPTNLTTPPSSFASTNFNASINSSDTNINREGFYFYFFVF